MSVIHLRIDNRLIHGQVTVSWVNSVGANHMICANDDVANDPIQKQLLPAAARGIKTSVLSIDETIDYVNSEQAEKEKIMVIAKFPEDALALLDKGLKPAEINVGNQAPLPNTKPTMVTKSVAVTPEHAEVYRKIAGKGYRVTARRMPEDSGTDFLDLLKKKGF